LFFKFELKPLLFLALSYNLELYYLELLSVSFNSIVGLISPLKAPSYVLLGVPSLSSGVIITFPPAYFCPLRPALILDGFDKID
jgi:hypothetical protein